MDTSKQQVLEETAIQFSTKTRIIQDVLKKSKKRSRLVVYCIVLPILLLIGLYFFQDFVYLILDFVFFSQNAANTICNTRDTIINMNVTEWLLMHGIFSLMYFLTFVSIPPNQTAYQEKAEQFIAIVGRACVGAIGLVIVFRANSDCLDNYVIRYVISVACLYLIRCVFAMVNISHGSQDDGERIPISV